MRHPRSAALLTATALAGLSLTLAFAPNAAADIPTPPLGTLSVDPGSPEAGGTVRVSGDGCYVVGAQSRVAGAATSAAPLDDPTPTAGQISISITGPGDFSGDDTATASDDGTWSADNGVTVGGAGEYTVHATCTLTDPILPGGGDGGTGGTGGGDQGAAQAAAPGQSLSFDYRAVTFTVAAPPTTVDPALTCSGCENVNPGGNVTIAGTDFPSKTPATVSLAGYGAQTSQVDADGALSPVTFVIQANQAAGTLSGSVTAGSATVPFSVVVTLPQAPGGDVDGNVPGGDDNGGTDTGTGDTDTTPVDVSYTSSAPTLPNTGTDSLWQGVLGGTLVLTGGGLLWLGRRRAAGAPVA